MFGKATAIQLGVLKLGIYSINEDIRGKYSDCFKGVGKLENFKLKLHINSKVEPVAQRMYRIPFTLREKVDKKLDKLESQDIIERLNDQTPWVCPVIVVLKPNGDIRLCVDMRAANNAIVRERHPIPTVDEILYKMNGGEWFSKMDLRYGFHQLELEEGSREITTFVTHRGLYRYKRLMFGINAAPEKYQQVISQVFHDIEGVQNISDDIVVFGRTKEEHDERLNLVLDRIRQKKLTLNGDKCEFTMDKITFMGHILSRNGIGPTQERVKDMLNATEPKNGSEVKSFLGLVNYSARYIPNLATISEPLRKLTKKNETFRWGKEQKESFEKLKYSLSEGETLGYYRLDADKTQLITDASNVGLGAVLVQENKGMSRVISYASRALSETEKKYSTTEKEGLAVVWAFEKFHLYLYGIDFEIITDHKALESLYNTKCLKTTQNARIQRWMLKLMSYNYQIKYLPGKQNIADALSRLVAINKSEFKERNVAEEFVRFCAQEGTPKALTTQEIEKEAKVDTELSEVRNCLQQAKWNQSVMSAYYPVKNELSVIGYLVMRGRRIIIPKTLQAKCLQLAHEGHLGIVGTKQMLRSKVWWPNMDKDVEKYVKSCHGCQITSQFSHPEPLEPTKLPTGPWQYLAIDLLGPLPSGHFVFVVIDYYSRYYEIDITKDTSSEKMIDSLENMFLRHGLPLSIRSDNGPQFTSKLFKQYLEDIDVKHIRNTPLYPAANGEVERQNRSLMKRIRIAQADAMDWKRELRKYIMAYRTKPHSVTGVSPSELLFKRKIRTKLPEIYCEEDVTTLDEEVKDRDMYAKHKNKIYIDEKRNAHESDLKTGDNVLVKQQYTNKMTTPFISTPYKLVDKIGNQCVVQSPEGVQYRRNTTHVKKYNDRNVSSEKDNDCVMLDDPIETPKPISDEAGDVTRRPVRERKMPSKFNDYIVS